MNVSSSRAGRCKFLGLLMVLLCWAVVGPAARASDLVTGSELAQDTMVVISRVVSERSAAKEHAYNESDASASQASGDMISTALLLVLATMLVMVAVFFAKRWGKRAISVMAVALVLVIFGAALRSMFINANKEVYAVSSSFHINDRVDAATAEVFTAACDKLSEEMNKGNVLMFSADGWDYAQSCGDQLVKASQSAASRVNVARSSETYGLHGLSKGLEWSERR